MVQRFLIQHLLSPLGKVMSRFSEKSRDIVFELCGLGIVLQIFLWGSQAGQYRFLIYFTIDCLLLCGMLLCSLPQEIHSIRIRWPFAVCWFIVGIMMLQSGLRLNMDYLPEAMLILVGYPVTFLIWSNGDWKRIFRLLIRICEWSFGIYLLLSFLFFPISRFQYSGLFSNVNGTAAYLAVVFACLLTKILYSQRLDVRCALRILFLGICAALIYYTNSRTGMLEIICAALVGIMLYLVSHSKADAGKTLIKFVTAALAVFVCVHGLVYVFQLRRILPLPYYDHSKRELVFVEGEPEDTNINNEPGVSGEHKGPDKIFGISGFDKVQEDKNTVEGKNLEAISTGRTAIWRGFVRKLNLFGHGTVEPVYVEYNDRYYTNPHMVILTIAYESGVFAGICYLLMKLYTGFAAIGFAWKERKEKFALFPIIIIITFGVESVLASNSISFWNLSTFYYYLVLFPIVIKLSGKQKSKGIDVCGCNM